MDLSWAIALPLLPWLATLWIALGFYVRRNRGESEERGTAGVALAGVGLSLLGILTLDLIALVSGLPGQIVLFPWLASGQYRVLASLTLDLPALVMATLVAGGALFTLIFSVNYMHREAGFQRFFAILCLFTGGMELVALAGNAVLTFIGWEVAGLSSYLLIAYAYDRPIASKNATRAFITNRFGDAGFILSITIAFLLAGGVEWPTIFASAEHLNSLLTGGMAMGFLLAALVKSAQFPFVAWIGKALEGPTPSSAIFYGALMAHGGAFLLIRLSPLLILSPFLMGLLLTVGLLTAAFGWLVGAVQTDVKSALIFSTQGQIGLIVAECGAGWFDLALWHLAAHTLWRLYQFLISPSYMHLSENAIRPVPRWLARQRALYPLALQRFWFDPLADALLTRPILALARDVEIFDERVVGRMTGLPVVEGSSAAQGMWEDEHLGLRPSEAINIVQGKGILGKLLENTAQLLHWFEEHLVLTSGDEGLLRSIAFLGLHVDKIDQLLSQLRYPVLLIILTFTVIL